MRGLGACALVALLASCGGGDDGSDALPVTVEEITTTVPPAGLALTDWQETSRAICDAYTPRVEAAIASVGPNATDEELIVALIAAVDVTIEYVRALLAVPVPTQRTREVNEVNDRLGRGEQQLLALRSSADRRDYSGFNSSISILINYSDTDDLYRALGVPECAPPEE